MNFKKLLHLPTSFFLLARTAFLVMMLSTTPALAQVNTVSVRTITYTWALTRTTTSPTAGPGMMPYAVSMTVLPGHCVLLNYTVTATRSIASTVDTPCAPGSPCPATPAMKYVNASAVLTDLAEPGIDPNNPNLVDFSNRHLSFSFTSSTANPVTFQFTDSMFLPGSSSSKTLNYSGTLCLNASTPCGQKFSWDNFAHLVGSDSSKTDFWYPYWVEIYTGDCTPMPYCTYTQGGYGGPGAPFKLMKANFPLIASPTSDGLGGFTIGSGSNILMFGSPSAVQNYLPAGGKPGVLPHPGVFGGQVLTLSINVYLSNGNGTPSSFGNLLLCNSGALNGTPVAQVLQDANVVLGGGPLPSYVTSISGLNDLVTNLNQAFDDCNATGWANTHLCALP